LKLVIVRVGAAKKGPLNDAYVAYERRLSRYTRVETCSVKETRDRNPEMVRRSESEALLRVAERVGGARRVVLDERGIQPTSVELADRIAIDRDRSTSAWVVCIGGAFGHSDAFRDTADWTWSLSSLTLPHELALVVAIEQLYRAHTILRGEPYHKA